MRQEKRSEFEGAHQQATSSRRYGSGWHKIGCRFPKSFIFREFFYGPVSPFFAPLVLGTDIDGQQFQVNVTHVSLILFLYYYFVSFFLTPTQFLLSIYLSLSLLALPNSSKELFLKDSPIFSNVIAFSHSCELVSSFPLSFL